MSGKTPISVLSLRPTVFRGLTHDEQLYPNPYEFRPERYIEDPKLPMIAYGFGRRHCIGQNLAKEELFIEICQLLWSFEFKADKAEVENVDYTEKTLVRPKPFHFDVRERHAGVRKLVDEEFSKPVDVEIKGF